ncbi:hypothetical protein OPT61_g5830 [Boeremia exigua]|uniref:Uncharacterized protein n=1 Tax=Boeremia exigua TaxID=749465 RepID=A0ACC2I903_9PLEO|nr:hypothetical protein OPT61_g5830 [Boeremia exigua]
MKLVPALTLALAADAVGAAALKARHYVFPALTGTADWSSIRVPANNLTREPITDVNSPLLRCYQLDPSVGAPVIEDVAADKNVTFKISPFLAHPGPIQFYMAKVPAGSTAATWDGSGDVWFKIYAEPLILRDAYSSGTWASQGQETISVTIPKNTPPGEYLLRIEHLALHNAYFFGGAQFHVACAQIRVTGGGTGTPGPLVAFPGAYKPDDPALRAYLFTGFRSYTPPGPPVWSG